MRSPATSPANDAQHRPPPPPRRKGTTGRAWLIVSPTGGTLLEDVWKHSIMRRTGLPARDLRVLDPLLSYPSTILGRERAIVINLEHIKAIITATEVLVANSKDILVAPFVQELQSRVAVTASDGDPQMTTSPPAMGSSDTEEESAAKAALLQSSAPGLNGTSGHETAKNVIITGRGAKALPFEFKALEVCLESACRCLESEASILEQEAYPALDELTSKISTLNLERVRQIKSRLVAISGRVQKVRDELEHLLDDDMDMAEMYLTEKLVCQPAGESPSRDDLDADAPEPDDEGDEDLNSEIESSRGSLGGFKPNIEELEMLLEAYFVQIDGTLNKLSTLREYVDDTEDYINIMLDEKQNQLLQMGVMLSTATLVVTAGVSIVGLFGMNITIGIYNDQPKPGFWDFRFWETTIGTVVGCIVLYIIAIGWGKKSGLLQ